MIQAITGIEPEEITFDSRHVLFVEGKENSIDVSVLEKILPLKVKPLGPSYNIKSAAQAFANVHPTYYFLIDRDHYEDSTVEDYWDKFPLADTPNLLIWRKKEIENYFLDSAYLRQSSYIDKKKSELDIQKIIIHHATQILYMSVVNQVIISIREDFKRNWIKIFRDQSKFPDAKTALRVLFEKTEFTDFSYNVSSKSAKEELQLRFDHYLALMTGNESSLVWGKGKWLHMISGKNILHNILGSSLFTVIDREGNKLIGSDKETEILRDLLSPERILPNDFTMLARMLKERAIA